MEQRQNQLRRRLFIFAGLSLIASPTLGQDCSSATVEELKADCIELLMDAQNLVISGDSFTDGSIAKFEEALEPSLKCLEGGYDLLKAAFKDCNPSSGVPDPVSCLRTINSIPEIIEDCETAVRLIIEALEIRRQAIALYGRAHVSFSDSGGDEIAAKLADCGETTCLELATAISRLASERRATAERDIQKLERLVDDLGTVDAALELCQDDTDQCNEVPQFEIPTLEGKGEALPPIVIP